MDKNPYKAGDIVWVQVGKRLGWWPGIVENMQILRPELKDDVTDKTIAVVKYLNEDNYKFVEDVQIIRAYNCQDKEEFIMFGMKKYFEKKRVNETSSVFMKFPNDVKRAEILTGGNPELINKDRFQPKKQVAQSRYKDIFVDPRGKETVPKSPKVASPRRSGRPGKSPARITHPRFQGRSDHEVRIRRQSSPINQSANPGYTCDVCGFSTSRVNVIICHRKTHTNDCVSGQKRVRSPTKKMTVKRKKVQEENEDLFDQVKRNLSGNASETKEVRQKKSPPKPSSKPVNKSPSKAQLCPKKKWLNLSQKEVDPEVKMKLMADWEEDEDDKKEKELDQSTDGKKKTDSDSEDDVTSNSFLLVQKRSDDEEEDDEDIDHDGKPNKSENMGTDRSSHGKLHEKSENSTPNNVKCISEDQKPNLVNSAASTVRNVNESLENISAEIDKLNAEMGQVHSGTLEQTNDISETDLDPSDRKINLEPQVNQNDSKPICDENHLPSSDSQIYHNNSLDETNGNRNEMEDNTVDLSVIEKNACPGISDDSTLQDNEQDSMNSKSDDQLKQEVESLLAETTVPDLPELVNIKSGSSDAAYCDTTQNDTESKHTTLTSSSASDTNENIIMQVEGGETYMVMWEPGSNIQDLLSYDGGENTRTLIIDSSTIQPGTDLENLFQIAVDAGQAEQSDQTTRKLPRAGSVSEQNSGSPVKDLKTDDLIWAEIPHKKMFFPGAVLHLEENSADIAIFDVEHPNNLQKINFDHIISVFEEGVNTRLLKYARKKTRDADMLELRRAYDHAYKFQSLKQTQFPDLSVHQYLACCSRSPVKVFSQKYLNPNVEDSIELPMLIDDIDVSEEKIEPLEDRQTRIALVEKIIDNYIMSNECLEHLKAFVKTPSEQLRLYERQKWGELVQVSTVGIFENSYQLYSKAADFLSENVSYIKEMIDGKDHRRNFVLNILLPEALKYGVQREFHIARDEAAKSVIYGISHLIRQ